MARARNRRGRAGSKRLTAALAVTGTVIGVLAGATALFDWFGAKVDAPDKPPPAHIDARVLGVDLRSTRQRLGDFLDETHTPKRSYTKFELGEQGYVFLVRMRAKGNQGQLLGLEWSVVDASSDKPLVDSIYHPQPTIFRPRGPDQARTWPIWVPYPPQRGTYVVRAGLVDGGGGPLDQADSDRFTLARDPGP